MNIACSGAGAVGSVVRAGIALRSGEWRLASLAALPQAQFEASISSDYSVSIRFVKRFLKNIFWRRAGLVEEQAGRRFKTPPGPDTGEVNLGDAPAWPLPRPTPALAAARFIFANGALDAPGKVQSRSPNLGPIKVIAA